ncbi:MAG TPA: hypothetical protein VN843_10630, partial [Anaerolineales bacterium]|nr:hypothetical protein [Anaerolineales bacterium]
TPNKIGQQEQIARSRLDAVQLLEHARRLSDDARALKPLEEIALQTGVADTVWSLDQPLAERLLVRSFELTTALLKESSDPTSASNTTDLQTIFARISSIASKYDPKLEKKLKDQWQETFASVGENGNGKSRPDSAQLSNLLLTQSVNYLASDEQKSRQLFRQSVSLRVSQDHYFFLLSQRKRGPELADALFSDTLDVLAGRHLIDANEILMLSSYLFSPDGYVSYVAISGYNTANVAANMTAAPKNPILAKRYLSLLLMKTNADEVIPPAVGYFAFKNLLPQYQVLVPELLDEVYAKLANLLPSVSKDDSAAFNDAHKDFHASETETTADWEKRIDKADQLEKDDWRDFEYFTILFGYLLPKKDFTRAALLVNRISNKELKEKSGDLVSLNELQARLQKAETASSILESDCTRIKSPLVRVVALSSLGQVRFKQKATGDALRLFDLAAAEANQIADDQDRLQAKLMLVQLALNIDSSVGFAWAAGTFKEINKFSDFNVNRSSFSLKV